MVVQIAAAYAVSGLQGDAKIIAADAFRASPALVTKDNLKLLDIALKASAGEYPPEQDFYVFSDDTKRLDAYLLVSNLAQRNGNTVFSMRALNDSVKLIQKAGFSGSRPQSVLDIALVASGII
jgi:hypothetical protein